MIPDAKPGAVSKWGRMSAVAGPRSETEIGLGAAGPGQKRLAGLGGD